jgi:hypothetical protein
MVQNKKQQQDDTPPPQSSSQTQKAENEAKQAIKKAFT